MPYTEIGIRRLLCVRCGDQATAAWQICADKSRYRPICGRCDRGLNELVLAYMNDPDTAAKMAAYKGA